MHYVGDALNVSVSIPSSVNSNCEMLGITTHITPLSQMVLPQVLKREPWFT